MRLEKIKTQVRSYHSLVQNLPLAPISLKNKNPKTLQQPVRPYVFRPLLPLWRPSRLLATSLTASSLLPPSGFAPVSLNTYKSCFPKEPSGRIPHFVLDFAQISFDLLMKSQPLLQSHCLWLLLHFIIPCGSTAIWCMYYSFLYQNVRSRRSGTMFCSLMHSQYLEQA